MAMYGGWDINRNLTIHYNSLITNSEQQIFANPCPLSKYYGNQPSIILNGAIANNHNRVVQNDDSSSNKAAYINKESGILRGYRINISGHRQVVIMSMEGLKHKQH